MKKINFEIPVKCWKDKSTKSWIIYSRKYDVSAYGHTKQLAAIMFHNVIGSILLWSKPSKKRK